MRKLVSLSIVGLAVAGAAGFGTYTVSAMHGVNGQGNGTTTAASGYGQGNGNGTQTALESRAKALNMTADQLQAQLQTKTMLQIAQDKGMTLEQYQQKMQEASQSRWQDRGLSTEEIVTRTAAQAERQADCDGTGNQQHMGGNGPNRVQ